MIYLYIILGIFFLFLLVILVPLKIEFRYELNTNFDSSDNTEQLSTLNYINFYLFNFIKIKKIMTNDKEKTKEDKKKLSKKIVWDIFYEFILQLIKIEKTDEALLSSKELKKIKNSLYFEKLDLKIGVNFKDVILNAYIISLLNSLINIYFAKNAGKINFSKTSYLTFISNKIINVKVNSIIKVKSVNTIYIIIKLIIRYRKVVKKDGRATSNRKLNANSYDFT